MGLLNTTITGFDDPGQYKNSRGGGGGHSLSEVTGMCLLQVKSPGGLLKYDLGRDVPLRLEK